MFDNALFQDFVRPFLSLFIIMDIIGVLPIFISLSHCLDLKHRCRCANRSILVAGVVLFIFLFFGLQILGVFRISLPSFMVAGGIILLLLGIKIVLGIDWHEARVSKYGFAAVPIGTPLITGPGAITTVILLSNEYGYFITVVAALLNLLICWIALHYSQRIYDFLGHQGTDIVSRIMGLIITAMAVTFIREGLLGM